jgi:hypothetical protein
MLMGQFYQLNLYAIKRKCEASVKALGPEISHILFGKFNFPLHWLAKIGTKLQTATPNSKTKSGEKTCLKIF